MASSSGEAQTQVSKEEVRILVLDHGYQKTEQLTGIKAATLRQWAKRFKWFKSKPHSQAVTTVTSPAQALTDNIESLGKETKLSLAKAIKSGASTFEEQPGTAIIKQSRNLKDIVGSASQLHGWEKGNSEGQFNLNVLSGQTVIQVGTREVDREGTST